MRGYQAIVTDHTGLPEWTGTEWLWREDRIQLLLSADDAEFRFISGCVGNQVTFSLRLDHVILDQRARRSHHQTARDPHHE